MLDASCREAEDVLLSQTFSPWMPARLPSFKALLDHPLPPTDKLRRLLKTKGPWEK